MLHQRRALFRVLNLHSTLQKPLDCTKLLNQIPRRLLADARSAWNVVRRVTPKGEQIRDLFRSNTEKLVDFRAVHDQIVFGGIQNKNGIDNLVKILIQSNDHGLQSDRKSTRLNYSH